MRNLRIVCGIVSTYFFYYEMRQIFYQGFLRYFGAIWDYFDFSLSVLYAAYLIVLYAPHIGYGADTMAEDGLVRGIQVFIMFVAFIKLTFYLRIFDGLSFLVQML